jgi:hypothetical protein
MPAIQLNFTAGDEVVQKLPQFAGVVKDVRIAEGKTPEYLVGYIDPETGDTDERWFTDEHIKAA